MAAGRKGTSGSDDATQPESPRDGENWELEFGGDAYVELPTLKYDGSHPITFEATVVPTRLQTGNHKILSNQHPGDFGCALEMSKEYPKFLVYEQTRPKDLGARFESPPRLLRRIRLCGI